MVTKRFTLPSVHYIGELGSVEMRFYVQHMDNMEVIFYFGTVG